MAGSFREVIRAATVAAIWVLAGTELCAQGSVRPTPTPFSPAGGSALDAPFVRNQALLGVLVYGPAFAATVANEPIAWAVSYVVVGGGSYFVAAQLNRDLHITDDAYGFFAPQGSGHGFDPIRWHEYIRIRRQKDVSFSGGKSCSARSAASFSRLRHNAKRQAISITFGNR